MNKYDTYQKDLTTLKNLEGKLQELLKERRTLKDSGSSTNRVSLSSHSKIDIMLKSKLDNFNMEITNLDKAVYLAESDSSLGVSEKEASKRRGKIDDYKIVQADL
jgi:hypothetical protein